MKERFAELDGRWWHSIELGDGIVTRGHKGSQRLNEEWRTLQLPPLHGKTVLDIGAWDGYFSFRCEQEGAERVVALDHYVWSLDPLEVGTYVDQERKAGRSPRPYDQLPELWRPDELPGKQCFDFAHQVLDSGVEDVVGDFMEVDLDELGTFDVVLYLGVLYHVKDPVRALERVASVTRELAVIETEAISVWPYNRQPLWLFLGDDTLDGDPTNWWMPNLRGLEDACRSAGFDHVEVGLAPTNVPLNDAEAEAGKGPSKPKSKTHRILHEVRRGEYDKFRIVARAWK